MPTPLIGCCDVQDKNLGTCIFETAEREDGATKAEGVEAKWRKERTVLVNTRVPMEVLHQSICSCTVIIYAGALAKQKYVSQALHIS